MARIGWSAAFSGLNLEPVRPTKTGLRRLKRRLFLSKSYSAFNRLHQFWGHLRNPSYLPPKMNTSRAPNMARLLRIARPAVLPHLPAMPTQRRLFQTRNAGGPAAPQPRISVDRLSFLISCKGSPFTNASLPSLGSSLPFPWSDLSGAGTVPF
jgi:hypothetical protein